MFQMSDWSLELCVNNEKQEPDPPRNFFFKDFKHLLFRDLPIGLILSAGVLVAEILRERINSKRLFQPTRRHLRIIVRVSPVGATRL